jgi:hypothetical protein
MLLGLPPVSTAAHVCHWSLVTGHWSLVTIFTCKQKEDAKNSTKFIIIPTVIAAMNA